MSYGFYQLVRILGMAGFAWLAYKDSSKADKTLMIVWIVSVLLINPFLKVPLGRHIWNVVDVVWAIILLITIWWDVKVKKKKVCVSN
jgi:FtsH-binding integral membrane protein